MKLYTEEQVKSICYAMIDYAIECGQELDTVIDKRLKSTISIELPSDEEIEKYIKTFPYTKHLDDGQYNDGVIVGAELGIEWYKKQLKSR